jgi:hypothetical protein
MLRSLGTDEGLAEANEYLKMPALSVRRCVFGFAFGDCAALRAMCAGGPSIVPLGCYISEHLKFVIYWL